MTHSPDKPRSHRGAESPATADPTARARSVEAAASRQVCARAGHTPQATVLLSCRGTWLVHQDQTEECTEAGCSVPAEAHEFVVQCSAVLTACGCSTG